MEADVALASAGKRLPPLTRISECTRPRAGERQHRTFHLTPIQFGQTVAARAPCMEPTIAKLRVWPIWKGLKHFAVSAVCEDSSTGARVNEFCQSLSRYLEPNCKITKELWLLSELRTPQLRSIAATETAQADLVVVSIHHAETLPEGLQSWIDLWLGQRRNHVAVLLALFDPLHLGSSSSLQAHLGAVAKKGNMEFLVQSEEAPEDR